MFFAFFAPFALLALSALFALSAQLFELSSCGSPATPRIVAFAGDRDAHRPPDPPPASAVAFGVCLSNSLWTGVRRMFGNATKRSRRFARGGETMPTRRSTMSRRTRLLRGCRGGPVGGALRARRVRGRPPIRSAVVSRRVHRRAAGLRAHHQPFRRSRHGHRQDGRRRRLGGRSHHGVGRRRSDGPLQLPRHGERQSEQGVALQPHRPAEPRRPGACAWRRSSPWRCSPTPAPAPVSSPPCTKWSAWPAGATRWRSSIPAATRTRSAACGSST